MTNARDAPASPMPGASLYALFVRDMRAGRRIGGGTSLGLVFFLILVTLSAFAVGPDLALLGKIAPAILWISGLLATLLGLDRLFQSDHEDGSLDLLLTSGTSLELIVLVKCLAHWILTGLPLSAAAPVFWPHARPANEPALERHSFAYRGHPRPDLDRRDRRGVDGQPAPRRTFVRGVDFAALRAGSDLRRRGGWSGGGFDGPVRNPVPDPLRPDPDRDRRRAFCGGLCFAANKHVSSATPVHENPEPVSAISKAKRSFPPAG